MSINQQEKYIFYFLCKYSVTLVLPISDFISTFVGGDTVFSREYK